MKNDPRVEGALAWATALLGEGRSNTLESVELSGGNEATCLLLASSDGAGATRHVLKVYRRTGDSFDRHTREFDGLQALQRASESMRGDAEPASPFRFLSPVPIGLCEDTPAVLMEEVPGVSLDSWLLGQVSPAWLDAASSALVEGLHRFHDVSGGHHGDVQFRNVLAADSSVALLDPGHGPPDLVAFEQRSEFGAMSIDLAVLVLSVGFTSSRRYLRDTRLFRRRASFARAVLAHAATRRSFSTRRPFLRETAQFARDLATRQAGSLRPSLVAIRFGYEVAIARSRPSRRSLARRPAR